MDTSQQDEQHLSYLEIAYYVLGGITALFALFPLIHVGLGIAAVLGSEALGPADDALTSFMGWFFIVIGTIFILIGQSIAALTIYCGYSIKRRKRYMFVFVLGCIQCAFFPLGTILGVFSIIVLCRPAVKALFEKKAL